MNSANTIFFLKKGTAGNFAQPSPGESEEMKVMNRLSLLLVPFPRDRFWYLKIRSHFMYIPPESKIVSTSPKAQSTEQRSIQR